MSTQDGKKPISKKGEEVQDFGVEFSGDITKLSPQLKKELEDQDLAWRWVDYLKLKQMDGYHPRGWQIYRRKAKEGAIIDNQETRLGTNPDGFVRRGTLVLVVRSNALNDKHKKYLKDRASRYSGDAIAAQGERLRAHAKEHNIKTRIVEGYDD